MNHYTTHASGVTTEYEFRSDGEAADPGNLDFGSGDAPRRCVVKSPGGAVISDLTISRDADQNVVSETTTYGEGAGAVVRHKTLELDPLGRVKIGRASCRERV